MTDEAISPRPSAVDEFPTTASFVAVAAAETAELFAGCVAPSEAAAACWCLTSNAELN